MDTTRDRRDLAVATVNSLIQEHPATVEVFHRLGIDACCGGALTVRVAAERHGLDLEALLPALEEIAHRELKTSGDAAIEEDT